MITANLFSPSSSCRQARILSHPQVIEDQSDVHGQLSHLLRDTEHPFTFDINSANKYRDNTS